MTIKAVPKAACGPKNIFEASHEEIAQIDQ
jgi:hypothetical protein